jgi:hydroxyacylglutathione hydrolase
VFSGGSLIVGSAARTDLLGPDRTEELARAQYRSLRRLATLGDDVAVWPTHGAGSFCSAPVGDRRTTTIGAEKASNALLAAPDEDAFVAALLGSLGSYPAYFSRLGEINRRGPAVLDRSAGRLPQLPVPDLEALLARGAVIVDVRPVADFGDAHIPGAVSIPLRPQFATWLGWLIPADTPLVVVRNDDQDAEEAVWQARKVGYDDVAGELAGGMRAWRATGAPTGSISLLTPGQLGDAGRAGKVDVVDVRQDTEFAAGHLPGASHVELGSLTEHAGTLPDRPAVVMCGHGERAMTAASLLARVGRQDIAVLLGGPEEWSSATCQPLVTRA